MSELQILDEAREKFRRQERRLDDTRTRATALLGSAAIVTGLFGFRLSGHHGGFRLTLLIAALVAFVVVLSLTIAINWPVRKWDDGMRLSPWLAMMGRPEQPLDQFARELAIRLHDARIHNEAAVDRRTVAFRLACLALGVEVVCWAVAVVF